MNKKYNINEFGENIPFSFLSFQFTPICYDDFLELEKKNQLTTIIPQKISIELPIKSINYDKDSNFFSFFFFKKFKKKLHMKLIWNG